MLRSILFFTILSTGSVYGAVKHIPIKSGVALKPGEIYTAQVESAETVEIGWTAIQAKACTSNCIEVSQAGGRSAYATGLGGSMMYTPEADKVVVEFKNVSQGPVTIDVYRIVRICDAESCRFINNTRKGHTLVFKINELKSITTSQDRSYSVISGVAESGRPFRFIAVWYTDDRTFMNLEKGCTTWIKRYVDNHTPKEQYRPYIISGQNVGDGNNIILKSIDDCVGKANHFGVPEQEVFK
jgi:hypothetical protein